MKRYKVDLSRLIPDVKGDWVRYAEAKAKIIKLENKIKVLQIKRNLSGDH